MQGRQTMLAPADSSGPSPQTPIEADLGVGPTVGTSADSAPPGIFWYVPPATEGTLYVVPGARRGRGTLHDPFGSLSEALGAAQPGDEIHVASGDYAPLVVRQRFRSFVTVTGAGDGSVPRIAGATLAGAADIRFTQVAFSAPVTVLAGPGGSADGIQFMNVEISCGAISTTTPGIGLWLRGGTSNVLVADAYIHNCLVGFAANDDSAAPITSVSVVHSVIQDLPGDAVNLGDVNGLTIDHCVIRGMQDPAGVFHDDGIQFIGGVRNVAITNNVIANSAGQLLFIQDAVAPAAGSRLNVNVLVDNNLIYGAGAYAVQVQGGEHVTLSHNTIWYARYGALLLRKSSYSLTFPVDAQVVANAVQSYATLGGQLASGPIENLFGSVFPTSAPGVTHVPRASEPFVAPQAGNFTLVPSFLRKLRAEGERVGSWVLRSGAIGASLGGPRLSFGAPMFGITVRAAASPDRK